MSPAKDALSFSVVLLFYCFIYLSAFSADLVAAKAASRFKIPPQKERKSNKRNHSPGFPKPDFTSGEYSVLLIMSTIVG